LGGIVQGAWCFTSPFSLPALLPAPFAPLRTLRLRHYLGDSVTILQLGALHPQGFWGEDCTRETLVLSPSVFHSSKWSIRDLMVLELGHIYTVPRSFLLELESNPDIRFWKATPGGLLSRVWDNLFHPESSLIGGPESPPRSLNGFSTISQTRKVDLEADFASEPPQPGARFRTEINFSVAVKSDNADNPTFIWDERIWALGYHDPTQIQAYQVRFGWCALNTLRSWFLRYWCRLVLHSLLQYLQHQFKKNWHNSPDATAEVEAGRDCVRRAVGAVWWEWHQGSSLFFWRWPSYAKQLVLHGHPPWFTSSPLQYKVPQRSEPNAHLCSQMREKLGAPIFKAYIAKGKVLSLTSFFSVPKGEDDVCIIYDASNSGLNAVLWAPSFQLPISETLTALLNTSSWISDLNLGEHFHNFPLHKELQLYCGIDIRSFYGTTQKRRGKSMWLQWVCCMMGL